MFTVHGSVARREVLIGGEVVGAPDDVPVQYTRQVIRPDHISGTFVYDEKNGRWRVDLSGIRVSGYRRLTTGKLSEHGRHHTRVSEDKAPWSTWSDAILSRLNSAPVPSLGDAVRLDVPGVDTPS
jgi:hypothetical protein